MVNLFRPKTMRRMAVFMALVAPIVYLFGSLFFYLNGAHGGLSLTEKGEYIADVESYEAFQIFRPRSDFNRYGVAYHNNGDGTCNFIGTVNYTPDYNQYIISDAYNFLRDGSKYFFDFPDIGYSLGLVGYPAHSSPFIWSQSNQTVWSGNLFVSVQLDDVLDVKNFYANIWNLTAIFGAGNEPTIEEFHEWFGYGRFDYGYNLLNRNVYGEWPDDPTAYSNSQYLFSQFFAKDNFLVKWGENAISENPYGFAPFGYFWRYLDTNVLHLSNEQVGLMAYGYMYYAAHVLLFDVGFMLVTFFLSFIQKVGDKIGGEER